MILISILIGIIGILTVLLITATLKYIELRDFDEDDYIYPPTEIVPMDEQLSKEIIEILRNSEAPTDSNSKNGFAGHFKNLYEFKDKEE